MTFFGPNFGFYTKMSPTIVIPRFRDTLLEPKITKYGDPLYYWMFPITLLTLLRIPFLGRIGSISYVLPIRQNIDILNRDIRVGFKNSMNTKAMTEQEGPHDCWHAPFFDCRIWTGAFSSIMYLISNCRISKINCSVLSGF